MLLLDLALDDRIEPRARVLGLCLVLFLLAERERRQRRLSTFTSPRVFARSVRSMSIEPSAALVRALMCSSARHVDRRRAVLLAGVGGRLHLG
jgi:hypothetical protein